ncbi:MAG TPA: T9SS type A sorting domain-containing protein [Rubricoccaceae bacterium]
MRLLLLSAALVAVVPARAQPVDPAPFSPPLQVGNRWEYVRANHNATTPVVTGYAVATVDGEVEVDGQPYVVLTTQRFNPSGVAETPRNTCAYSRTLGTAPAGSTALPDYDCTVQLALAPPLPWSSGPTTVTAGASVEISSQSISVDSLVTFGSQGQGSGGAYSATVYTYATDIGYVSHRSWGQYHWGAGGGTYDNRMTLAAARLGGVVYGASVVAGEVAPEAEGAVLLSAYPNPFATEVTVTAAGLSGPVAFDVFDALGRRVGGGVSEAGAPFVFRPSAAGVYVVRAMDTAGHVATRRVVRR